jgi:hypothetical protein
VSERFDGLRAEALLADKACNSDKTIQSAQAQGMPVIISCKVNRKMQPPLKKERYKARQLLGLCVHCWHHEVVSLNFPNMA